MTVEMKSPIAPETVSQLQELIQMNVDSRDGFRHAANATDDLTLQISFEQFADDRDVQSDELARFVAWSGEAPRFEGSFAAVVNRAWMTIREMVSSDNRYAILCEMERGEDSLKAAYEVALRDTPASAASDVLVHQYAAVKATHDRIRDLRDFYAG